MPTKRKPINHRRIDIAPGMVFVICSNHRPIRHIVLYVGQHYYGRFARQNAVSTMCLDYTLPQRFACISVAQLTDMVCRPARRYYAHIAEPTKLEAEIIEGMGYVQTLP
jgi:hypothetical protein